MSFSGVLFLPFITTLQGTNISPQKLHFEDDVPFPQVGHVNSLEGNPWFLFTTSYMGILPPSVGGGPDFTRLSVSGLDRANMEVGGSRWGWHGHLNEALAFRGSRGWGENSVCVKMSIKN